jgi:hypothetical protein
MVREGRFQMAEDAEKLDQDEELRILVAACKDDNPFDGVLIGQDLQNWLLRNKIDVTHPLFVPAVDLAFKNAMRAVEKRFHDQYHDCALEAGERD